MISFDDLKYFKEVAQTGHMTRAAERLGLSQPALSHAIHKIELELKTQLFLRSKKGVQLTSAGQILLQSAQTLFDDWQRVREAISLNRDQPQGLIRLGCHAVVAQYTLNSFVADLLLQYPDLNLQLTHGLSRQITDLVIRDQLDVAFVVNPVRHPDLIMSPMGTDEVSLWCSKKCKNKDVLIYEPSLLQSLDILSKLKKKKIHFRRTLESSSLEVIAQLAIAGVGTAILPKRVLDIHKNHQCEMLKEAPVFKDEICLIYKKEFRDTVRGQVFLKAAKN